MHIWYIHTRIRLHTIYTYTHSLIRPPLSSPFPSSIIVDVFVLSVSILPVFAVCLRLIRSSWEEFVYTHIHTHLQRDTLSEAVVLLMRLRPQIGYLASTLCTYTHLSTLHVRTSYHHPELTRSHIHPPRVRVSSGAPKENLLRGSNSSSEEREYCHTLPHSLKKWTSLLRRI